MVVASTALSFTMVFAGVARVTSLDWRDSVATRFYAIIESAAVDSESVETLEFSGGGRFRNIHDHLGRYRLILPGTWKDDRTSIVTMVPIDVFDEDGRPMIETETFIKCADSLIITRRSARLVFVEISTDVAMVQGRYLANRPSAAGRDTLRALTLLPNGMATLSIANHVDGSVIHGTWAIKSDSTTNTTSIQLFGPVEKGRPGAQLFEFQVSGDRLVGTKYDTNRWGIDLAFEKFQPQVVEGAGRAIR